MSRSLSVLPPLPQTLIVEGPQGVGKSTLIRGLQSLYSPEPLLLKKAGYPPPGHSLPAIWALLSDLDLLERAAKRAPQSVILDRCLLSNVIYSLLRESPTGTDLLDPVSYLCSSGLETRIQRFQDAGGLLTLLLWSGSQSGSSAGREKPVGWQSFRGLDLPLYWRLADRLHFLGCHVFEMPYLPDREDSVDLSREVALRWSQSR